MDTFAAMALASLPPSKAVMALKPRPRSAFIITKPMWRDIIGTGAIFFIALIVFLYYLEHVDITSLTQIGTLPLGDNTGLSPYELSVFFSTFVFLQFWNMFNAKAFASGRSVFHFKGCTEFILIALVISVGQILIVSVGGPFFGVTPLSLTDWLIIIVATSAVLWVGELWRLIKK